MENALGVIHVRSCQPGNTFDIRSNAGSMMVE